MNQTEKNQMEGNWMKIRLAKLSQIRNELIERRFASEIIEVHDGVEEFLVKEIKGKLYVCSIHHTFVSWYFSEKTPKSTFPMYEDHFFKSIRSEDQSKCQNCGHQPSGTHVYLKQDSYFVYWICKKCGATIKVKKTIKEKEITLSPEKAKAFADLPCEKCETENRPDCRTNCADMQAILKSY